MSLDSGTMIIPHSSPGSSQSGTNWGTAVSETVSSGIISIGNPGLYCLSPEGGVADDLVTINGGTVGDEITLYTDGAATITIKDGSGNIKIGYDFPLVSGYSQIRLRKTSDNYWVGASGLATNA